VINRDAIDFDVMLELAAIQRRAEQAMAARREATQLGEAFQDLKPSVNHTEKFPST